MCTAENEYLTILIKCAHKEYFICNNNMGNRMDYIWSPVRPVVFQIFCLFLTYDVYDSTNYAYSC